MVMDELYLVFIKSILVKIKDFNSCTPVNTFEDMQLS